MSLNGRKVIFFFSFQKGISFHENYSCFGLGKNARTSRTVLLIPTKLGEVVGGAGEGQEGQEEGRFNGEQKHMISLQKSDLIQGPPKGIVLKSIKLLFI